jgi:hypothetical protein
MLLTHWSEAVLASRIRKELPEALRESRWLGFAPATDAQITAAETRLKIALPPSYKAFLSVSDGWRRTSFAIERVRGTREINWFRVENRDWIAAFDSVPSFDPEGEISDAEYFTYAPRAAAEFRKSHLRETLQISDVGDAAVYLLNPQVISSDGEWEAWFLANWLPGIHRYRSFLEMMQAEYHSFAGIEWKQPVGLAGKLPDEYVGSPGSPKRHRRKGRRQEPKALGRRLNQWTLDELLELLTQTDVPEFREELAGIIGRLGDPRAVDVLMEMLNEDSRATVSAIYAIRRLAPDRLLPESLLRLLQERHFFAFGTAVTLLAEMHDERAVPILADLLKDTRPEAKFRADYSGTHLAAFGQAGFHALVKLVTSDEPLVRQRAARGLLYCNRNDGAQNVFRKLLDDPDPGVRQTAETALKI